VVDIYVSLGRDTVPICASLGEAYSLGHDTRKCRKKLAEEMGYWPRSVYACNFHDSIFIMKTAIEKAKRTDPDKIAKAFKGIAGGPPYIRPNLSYSKESLCFLAIWLQCKFPFE
jgi:hypothetical protein